MQKKIIAVCCAVTVLAVLLASCGNKYSYVESGGSEYPVATDAEGNTEVNVEGKIAVYVTDANGDVVTNADGSEQKNYVDFPEVIVNGNTVETALYKFTMPDGWTANSRGKFIKNGEDNCTVTVRLDKQLDTDTYETFDTYLGEVIYQNEEMMEKVKEQYPDATLNVEDGVLSDGTTNFIGIETLMKDSSSGTVVDYAYHAYFEIDGSVYIASYICFDGAGYDESFDFKSIVEQNLIIK